MRWYYLRKNVEYGPVDVASLKLLAENGVVTPGTLVRHESRRDWSTAGSFHFLTFNGLPVHRTGDLVAIDGELWEVTFSRIDWREDRRKGTAFKRLIVHLTKCS